MLLTSRVSLWSYNISNTDSSTAAMGTDEALILFFFVLVFVVSLTANILLLVFTIRIYKRELATNIYISGICVADILSVISGMVPEFMVNYERTMIRQDNLACVMSGLSAFAFCIVTMNLFGALAFIQSLAIAKPFLYRRFFAACVVNNIYLILLIFIYGLAWSMIPFAVGSRYVPDLDHRRCSVDWKFSNMSIYVGLTVLIGFCVPITMQGASLYISKRNLLNNSNNMNNINHHQQPRNNNNNRNVDAAGYDRFYIRISTLTLGVFIALWTPYSVVGTMVTFGFYPSPSLFTVCALSAKLATLCNPAIFFWNSLRFNTFVKYVLQLKWCHDCNTKQQNEEDNEVSGGEQNMKQTNNKSNAASGKTNKNLQRHLSLITTMAAVISDVDVTRLTPADALETQQTTPLPTLLPFSQQPLSPLVTNISPKLVPLYVE